MLKDKILQLVQEYVTRQQIVFEAITDLRPDILLVADKSISDEHLITMVLKYKDVPSTGSWQKYGTWEYYIHGNGCRLTNFISRERIEWDVANLNEFYVPWFVNWVNWVKKINEVYSEITDVILHDLLNDLQIEGYIEKIYPENNHKLRLIRK